MNTILKYKYYFLSFLLLGSIVYFPMFFNGFVWDDIQYILENSQIHHLNFTIFYDNVFNSGPFYRQLTVLYNSLMYTIFSDNAFPYHLIQLLFHIICTSLLFLLFKNYFNPKISFILSLFFLVHPINAETVLWIGSTQVQLFTIPGLLALLVIHKSNLKEKEILILYLSLFLSIIAYEMGFFFFIVTYIYILIYKNFLKKHMFFTLFGLLGIYLFLRFMSNGLVFKIHHDQQGIQTTLLQTIYTMPSIILYYLKTLIFPNNLMIFQGWLVKEFSLHHVLLPTITVGLLLLLHLKLFQSAKKERKTLLFFSLWFFIGMASLIHIFPVEMTVSDRWFYFTFIGLLGVIGFVFQTYYSRIYKYQYLLLGIIILLLSSYSLRTFYRAFDWKDNITLFTHDLQYQKENLNIIYNLGTYYEEKGEYKNASVYYEKVAAATPTYPYALVSAAMMNEKIQAYDKALTYYIKAKTFNILPPVNAVDIDLAIARLLREKKAYTEISKMITDQKINKSSQAYILLFIRAEAYYKMGDYEKAFKDAEILYQNASDPVVAQLYNDIQAARNQKSEL